MVVHYGDPLLTRACIESLVRSDWPPVLLEVVVVDNAAEQPVSPHLTNMPTWVRLIVSPTNRGFAGGANLGFADLEGVDYVALVNNDATVDPGWLAPLVAALEDDPRLGAACPKIVLAGDFVDVTLSASTRPRSVLDRRRVGVSGSV